MAENQKSRKFKRVIPTRNAGEPTTVLHENPADDLFAEAFGMKAVEPEQIIEKLPTETETLPTPTRQTSHTSQTSQTKRPSKPRQTSHSSHTRQSTEISPSKDFQKIPNSLTKRAIPEGFFKQGKSKQLYDVLWSLTRAYIEPRRSIRISKTKLSKLAGIGSRITFDNCIAHLQAVGLIEVTVFVGEHDGNEFEIFNYDESLSRQTSQSSLSSPAQKLDTLVSLESSQTSHGLNEVNTEGSGESKTFIKTNETFDDDFATELDKYCVKATGRNLTAKDKSNLRELARIIGAEGLRARAKTKQVSSFMPFLIRHLEGVFAGRAAESDPPGSNRAKVKRDTVGAPATELDLNAELQTLRDLVELEGRESIEKWKDRHTPENWKWLMENL